MCGSDFLKFALGGNLASSLSSIAPQCKCKQTTTLHSHGFVMTLLQWHMVYNLGYDELHRPPVVAVNTEQVDMIQKGKPYMFLCLYKFLMLSTTQSSVFLPLNQNFLRDRPLMIWGQAHKKSREKNLCLFSLPLNATIYFNFMA